MLTVTIDMVLTLVIYRKKCAVSFGNSQRRKVSQATKSVGQLTASRGFHLNVAEDDSGSRSTESEMPTEMPSEM